MSYSRGTRSSMLLEMLLISCASLLTTREDAEWVVEGEMILDDEEGDIGRWKKGGDGRIRVTRSTQRISTVASPVPTYMPTFMPSSMPTFMDTSSMPTSLPISCAVYCN